MTGCKNLSIFFEIMPKISSREFHMFTLYQLFIHEISSYLYGYLFFFVHHSTNHQHHSFFFLAAYHHVNSHFVIHSFLCSTCHRRTRRAYFSAKKVFPLQRAQQKCIMHRGMSEIMFQRAGNFNAKNDNASKNLCTQSKSLHRDFTIFCHDTVATLLSCRHS